MWCLLHHFFQLEGCGLWTSKRYHGKHLGRLSTGKFAAEHWTSMFCKRPSLNIYVLQFGILLCSEHCKRKTALTWKRSKLQWSGWGHKHLREGCIKKVERYGLAILMGVVKNHPVFWGKVYLSETIQNRYRTPKTCFTSGLECLKSFAISIAIGTALKVVRGARILGTSSQSSEMR